VIESSASTCACVLCAAAKNCTLCLILLFLLLCLDDCLIQSEQSKSRVETPSLLSAKPVCRHRRSLCSVLWCLAIFGSRRSRIPFDGPLAHAHTGTGARSGVHSPLPAQSSLPVLRSVKFRGLRAVLYGGSALSHSLEQHQSITDRSWSPIIFSRFPATVAPWFT
jgi:hypothetical protein